MIKKVSMNKTRSLAEILQMGKELEKELAKTNKAVDSLLKFNGGKLC